MVYVFEVGIIFYLYIFLFVVFIEGRFDNIGVKVVIELLVVGILVILILDFGVGYMMEKVDMLLVGVEGVVESGGIINYIGIF